MLTAFSGAIFRQPISGSHQRGVNVGAGAARKSAEKSVA
jgi:hypothetical protein